ncbi:DUF4229 domain-containing protein [Actinotalea sp. AC32]|nr:DUF4229 domain-containing protein [Actinotalea sp. AC32]
MPVVTYSLLRLAVLVVAAALLWWAGVGGWLLAVLAVVVAWAVSYLFLRPQRDAAAAWLAARAERRAARPAEVDDDTAAEDAAADGIRRTEGA